MVPPDGKSPLALLPGERDVDAPEGAGFETSPLPTAAPAEKAAEAGVLVEVVSALPPRGAAAPDKGKGLKVLVLPETRETLDPENGNGLKMLTPPVARGAAAPANGKGLKTLVLPATSGALAPASGNKLKILPPEEKADPEEDSVIDPVAGVI
ncbi:MAG: hypothetical protein ACREJU_06165 [Nitrospiraceae bacterium]